MDIHDELNDQDRAEGPKDKKLVTVASLLLFGGALIAAPLLRRNRELIEHATERATASGRDLVKSVANKLPFVGKRKE